MYDLLEKEIAPLHYDRGHDGIPRKWVAKMKQSMQQLGPRFNSNRMVKEYTEKFYVRAYRQAKILERLVEQRTFTPSAMSGVSFHAAAEG